MNTGKLVFAQLMAHLPLTTFRRCVARYGGEHKVKQFTCLDQFLCMAFAQLTYRESLRDIEACLRSQAGKLYHMGFRSTMARNTLANANAVRDWRIYADFAQSLIGIARKLYVNEPFGLDLSEHLRPDRHIDCVLLQPALPRYLAAHPHQGCAGQDAGIPDQQHPPVGPHHCRVVPLPLADRAVLQVVKQHLRIKSFFGTSENAVKSQIWIAVSVYVLVAIIKKRLQIGASPYEMLPILSLTPFERTPLDQLLTRIVPLPTTQGYANQLILFD